MHTYAESVRKLIAEQFPDAHQGRTDRTWDAWYTRTRNRPTLHDLADILDSRFQDAIKARALTIFLSHNLTLVPFQWVEPQPKLHPNYLAIAFAFVDVNKLSQPLLAFASALVVFHIDFVRTKAPAEQQRKLLSRYNEMIITFLALLPEDHPLAQQLFDRFSINDIIPIFDYADSSGYNPLSRLLARKDIPIHWKRLANQQMQHIIQQECLGSARPRTEWESAPTCYKRILRQMLLGSDVDTVDLLTDVPELLELASKLTEEFKDDKTICGRLNAYSLLMTKTNTLEEVRTLIEQEEACDDRSSPS